MLDHRPVSTAVARLGKRRWREARTTPPTPAPQEARRSDQADCYADIHLRIGTLIGEAGCWIHAGYHEAIGSNHTESHIAHGEELPPGACWIIAPSQLLLHDWDAGRREARTVRFTGG